MWKCLERQYGAGGSERHAGIERQRAVSPYENDAHPPKKTKKKTGVNSTLDKQNSTSRSNSAVN